MLHLNPGQNQVTMGNADLMSASQYRFNNSAIVYQNEGSMFKVIETAAWAGFNTIRSAGLLISQPVVDATPYRIKAYIRSSNATPYVIVGLGPAAPTGTDDAITHYTVWPIGSFATQEFALFDEVIRMPSFEGSNEQRPIAIAIGVSPNVDGVAATCSYNLSVQNLSKTAPKFASSMS